MARWIVWGLLLLSVCAASGCAETSTAATAPPAPSPREQRFDHLVKKHARLTHADLVDRTPQRPFLERLSFDPADAKFYDQTVASLKLTDAEQDMSRSQGFVSVDHQQRYSFGSLYYAVYTSDLPVLVTTDSILHAMHRTYDDLLMELEETLFTVAIGEALQRCHERLASTAPDGGALADNCRDVDLYLTVARNLLKASGGPPPDDRREPADDIWYGELLVPSLLDQDAEAMHLLKLVQSLKMQTGDGDDVTEIYGGRRPIDYSQFRPRGHYAKRASLARYFRAMMWLGRADTGWNVSPPDPQSGIESDVPREVRNAVLLAQCMKTSGAIERLRQVSDIVDFLVGESDSLTVFQLVDELDRQGVAGVADLASDDAVAEFQEQMRERELGEQRIRSQVIYSHPKDPRQVPPPAVFQLFGQRFVIDSFVLSKVVYDSILHNGQKVQRMMPAGLDAMYAFGNDTALPLLAEDLEDYPYAPNLQASREFVDERAPEFWQANLYNIWLDAVRTVDDDLSLVEHAPEAMQTEAWQRKQLQTQLASWSELRHNTVLYAKQSYTSGERCEYPTGYVEPYPETYARIKFFAEEAARRITAADYSASAVDLSEIKARQLKFLHGMAETLGKLEALARKELAAKPFSDEDQLWLKKAIDQRGGGSGPPRYTGWYCELFYGGGLRSAEWDPTIIDVHTDPNSQTVLEVGVGDCNFLVAAIDNQDDRMIYVGPAYSYYEFRHPVQDRLTDARWGEMLQSGSQPPRPSWTEVFQPPSVTRQLDPPVRP
jgi:hypothetical protein